jgi:hypothetical protein
LVDGYTSGLPQSGNIVALGELGVCDDHHWLIVMNKIKAAIPETEWVYHDLRQKGRDRSPARLFIFTG